MEENKNIEELQDYEINEEEEGYKISKYEITSYVTQRSVESLLKWIEKKKIIIPDFQRDYVWPKQAASKLIDSVLLNLPIPNIFLYKVYDEQEEIFYVVDGFQRIQTLKFFKDGYWDQESNIKSDSKDNAKSNGSVFKINYKSSEWYKKSYNDLSAEDQFSFDEYSLNLTIFEQSNPKNKNSMFEVFERINTGADKLSEQEIRNAIYPGEFLKEIKINANNKIFKDLIKNDSYMNKRQNYIDLFLRFVSYQTFYKNDFAIADLKFTTSKKDTLNNICNLYNNEDKEKYINVINDVFKAIETIYNFSKTALYGKKRNERKISNKVHAVFAEALVLAVIKNNFKINISTAKFDEFKLDFWETEDFEKLFVQQTTSEANIQNRIKLLMDVINDEYQK